MLATGYLSDICQKFHSLNKELQIKDLDLICVYVLLLLSEEKAVVYKCHELTI